MVAADRGAMDRASGATTLPMTGRLLAVDWGHRRIGLAVSDPTQTIAQPLATLTRRWGRRCPLARLRAHLDRLAPVGIVVGLPLESDGTEGEAAAHARQTGTLLAEKTGLPVCYRDERMTTARALREVGPRNRLSVDDVAAALLLQQFLESRRTA